MRRLHLCAAAGILVSLMLFCSTGSATTFVEKPDHPFSFRNGIQQGRFEQSMKIAQLSQSPFLAQETPAAAGGDNVDIYGFKGKSLKRAFVYSLLIPGTGELYAGSKLRAAIFLGADVTLWALYFHYHGQGTDKESEYRDFADLHWSEEDYISWLVQEYGITSDTEPYYVDSLTGERDYFSHHLPSSKTGQYYEMIGKYQQFSYGWDDFANSNSVDREIYLYMRHNANDLLNKATYSAMFSLANHILSAFDAAILVRGYNKRGEKFSQIEVKTRLVQRQREVIPRLTLSMRF
jgi:hypothetical protein